MLCKEKSSAEILVFDNWLMYILNTMSWEGVNHRKFPRIRYKCLIRITKGKQEEVIDTFTENIGAGGICVVLEKDYGLFKNVSLELFLCEGRNPLMCRGMIVWIVKRHLMDVPNQIKYDTGIEFRNILEEDRGRISRLVQNILIVRP